MRSEITILWGETNDLPWEAVGEPTVLAESFGRSLARQTFCHLNSGQKADFSAFSQKDYVIVLPTIDDGAAVLMLREYKHGCQSLCFGFPAGGIEPGASIDATVVSEILEETGYQASNIHVVGERYIASGSSPTKYYMCVASCAYCHPPSPEPNEHLVVLRVPTEVLWDLILSGEISSGGHGELAFLAREHGYLS